MNPNDMWQAYMGNTQPVSLFERFQTHDAWTCAQQAAQQLPALYGIVRRRTWRDSFQPGEQFTRETVAVALWQHLEDTREDWEPNLPELKPAAPEPEPAQTAPLSVEAQPSEIDAAEENAEATSEDASTPDQSAHAEQPTECDGDAPDGAAPSDEEE